MRNKYTSWIQNVKAILILARAIFQGGVLAYGARDADIEFRAFCVFVRLQQSTTKRSNSGREGECVKRNVLPLQQ